VYGFEGFLLIECQSDGFGIVVKFVKEALAASPFNFFVLHRLGVALRIFAV
jgi:hypothetical protein